MSELSNVEALLLAQAVWELGSNAWHAVAKLLSKHPLIKRPKAFFAPNACQVMYSHLMLDAHLESLSDAVRAPENLQLAQVFYERRLEELRSLIAAEESKFKDLLAEIDAIRSGHWNEHAPSPKEPDVKVSAELVDDSELSGVTDSPHDVIMERAQGEEQDVDEQPAASIVQQENPETPGKDDMVLDVHVTIEEYPRPEKEIADHAEPEPALVTDEAPPPSLDEQSVEEFIQAHRQEEEEEEEEREVVRPEEEEAEQELEAEPVEQDVASPAPVEVKDEVPLTIDTSNQAPESEKPGEGTTNEEEPQPSVRRSRRHRASTSTAPSVQPKGPKTRRSRRFSEAAETSPVSVDDEHEIPDADTAPEEADHDQVLSPVGDEQRGDGKRKASLIEAVESPRDRKRHRDESEPADEDEPGPSSAATRGKRRGDKTEGQVALKRFQNVIGMLHAQISQHRNGNIFHNPIKKSEAADYHEIVKRPIDLKTIKAKVKDGHIVNSLEFQRDIYLMFANAMMYNVPGSDVYAMAEDMMLESESHISSFRQTEGLVRRL